MSYVCGPAQKFKGVAFASGTWTSHVAVAAFKWEQTTQLSWFVKFWLHCHPNLA